MSASNLYANLYLSFLHKNVSMTQDNLELLYSQWLNFHFLLVPLTHEQTYMYYQYAIIKSECGWI